MNANEEDAAKDEPRSRVGEYSAMQPCSRRRNGTLHEHSEVVKDFTPEVDPDTRGELNLCNRAVERV